MSSTTMLSKQSSMFFILIFFLSSLAVSHQSDDVFAKHISPSSLGLKREKLSHLRFYFHDVFGGQNPTAVRVAEAKSSANSSSSFGVVVMIDDPLTIKPDLESQIVGRAQGFYAFASQTESALLMLFHFAFTHGKYNGSNLSVLGRNRVISDVREMSIIGGSGLFRFARGYVQAKTFLNGQTQTIVEYNVYVFHY